MLSIIQKFLLSQKSRKVFSAIKRSLTDITSHSCSNDQLLNRSSRTNSQQLRAISGLPLRPNLKGLGDRRGRRGHSFKATPTIDRLKAEEEASRLRQQQHIELRNAEREMEIAAAKIEILEIRDSLSSTHSNAGKRVNCTVSEQPQFPNALPRVLANDNVISNTQSTSATSINGNVSTVNVTPVCEVRNSVSIPQQSVSDNTRVNTAANHNV